MDQRRWDHRFGVIAELLYRANFTGEPMKAADFFPSLGSLSRDPRGPNRKPTREEVRAGARALFEKIGLVPAE